MSRDLRPAPRILLGPGPSSYSARRENVLLLLGALEHVLRREGSQAHPGTGVDAALSHYRAANETPVSA